MKNLQIYNKKDFMDLKYPSPMMTKYSIKSLDEYEYFCIIPYELYSTKIKGIEQYQKDIDFSVYELRVVTIYLSVLICTTSEEDMLKVLSNNEIIKSRK